MLTVLSCLVALILLIWFKTDAIVEWTDLLSFGGKKHTDYWDRKKTEEYPLTYPHYLRMKHDNFFIKLITCPICLAVWLSIIHCVVIWQIILIPVVCIFSLIIYGGTVKLLDI